MFWLNLQVALGAKDVSGHVLQMFHVKHVPFGISQGIHDEYQTTLTILGDVYMFILRGTRQCLTCL